LTINIKDVRVNERIRVPQVRLVGPDGELIGVLATREALTMAQEQGLDLVEVAAKSRPPVCRIMDFGKFKYEQSKKARKAKKKQHTMQLKEVKLRPKIDEHDYHFKVRHAREFLENRDKVKITLTYRGREMAHIDLGRKVMERAIADLADVANIEQHPKLEDRNMTAVLVPKPQVHGPRAREHDEEDEAQGEVAPRTDGTLPSAAADAAAS
jgi:translation initiation factor IF-3